MGYQAVLLKLPSACLSEHLEDVLTGCVVGAVAYGPAGLAQEWLRSCAGIEGASADLVFKFWPGHRLGDDHGREPDVLVTDRSTGRLLIVEAKRDSDPEPGQLIEEGEAVMTACPGMALHLLTISDQATRPRAFGRVGRDRPGLYASMRHVTWADMYRVLEARRDTPDAGHRRMLEDALAVMRKFGRDPFRGMTTQEVRAMERDLGWMVTLPRELVKLHRGLSRTLEKLHPPLHAIGRTVRTDIVGSVSYSTPEQWLPRHFTLRYGESRDTTSSRYFFVRAVLNPPQIWVGYAAGRSNIRAMLADPDAVERLLRLAGRSARLVAVTPKGQPFEIVAGPVEVSRAGLQDMADDPRVERLNIVAVFPTAAMSKPNADARLEAALLRMVRACRGVEALGAP
jgi:hypothetical protein